MKTAQHHNDLTKNLDTLLWVLPMVLMTLVATICFALVQNFDFAFGMAGFAMLLVLIFEIDDLKFFKSFNDKNRFGKRIFLRFLLSGRRLNHPSVKTI